MIFLQYELECLSLYSYLIGDATTGRAVVVDPQRDVSEYIADAAEHGLTIERVIETHFHADFLSGHLELASRTGAVISYGSNAQPDFDIDPLEQGRVLSLGDVTLEIRHTPGHTPEGISIVVRKNADDEPWAVLTGDTLFIGDVGRPDLLTSVGKTADELARDLFRSLHDQLLTLPDDTIVYPAHGAGSACGKNLSAAPSSTIGEQRETNYALADMTEDEFVAAVTEGQSAAPLYFEFAADANKRQRDLLDDTEAPDPLTIEEVLALRDDTTTNNIVFIDTRSPERFASGHVRTSINVGLDGRFAEYAGAVVRPGEQVVIFGDAGRSREAKIRLARIGFDDVVGAVDDVDAVLLAHPELATVSHRLTATDVNNWLNDDQNVQLVDVRNPGETRVGGTIVGAQNLPLPQLLDFVSTLDPTKPTIVYCAGGYRSAVAASLLRAKGFGTVADLIGGYGAWAATGLPVS